MEKKKFNDKTKRPAWFKPVLIVCSIVLGISALLGGAIACFRLPVQSYYNASEVAFKIPDIDNGYVPQGMHYEKVDDNTAYYVLSGYMSNDKPSPLYLLDMYGELKTSVTLTVEKDGEYVDYFGHCGGVAVYKDWIYVTGNCELIVYKFSELCSAENGAKLKPLGKISLKNSDNDYVETSFVTVYKDKERLIVGGFYRDGESFLDSHKIKTATGDYNHALAVEYSLSASAYKSNFGLASSPSKAYSLPDKVQGIALTDDSMYLSTSYHLNFSYIRHYKNYNSTDFKHNEKITVLGYENITLYELNSENVTKVYKIAPMSEEIAFVNSKLVVNCESACNKYIVGKFTGSKVAYATKLFMLDK